MATTEESWLSTSDGVKLYTKTWKPQGTVKARLVFTHGFADHCNTHKHFFNYLANAGIQVHTWDQRGFGLSAKSPKDKGLTGPTATVLADMDFIINTVISSSQNDTGSSPPIFLMGHSMGGGETLTFAALGPHSTRKHIRGYIVEAPWILLSPATEPWAITVSTARIVKRFMPHYHMVNKVRVEYLSRDQEVGRQIKEDELCHDTGTLEGLEGALDRAAALVKGQVVLKDADDAPLSVLATHGSGDQVTSIEGTRKAFEMMDVKDKEFKEYDGWYHKLHDEIGECKDKFAKDIADWIFARAS